MSDRWREVWANRQVEVADGEGDVLSRVMAADGHDTEFGAVTPSNWTAFVRETAVTLGITEGDSLFEVGCGAGAFLYPLRHLNLRLGGLELSAPLITAARRLFPDGEFIAGEATELDPSTKADFVVSCGVFLYFPDVDYAERVIHAMAAKARRAVAILDLPDVALEEAALRERKAALGGDEAYAERYAGLQHLHFDREWVAERLCSAGLQRVQVSPQMIRGYANGRYRFNAWGFVT